MQARILRLKIICNQNFLEVQVYGLFANATNRRWQCRFEGRVPVLFTAFDIGLMHNSRSFYKTGSLMIGAAPRRSSSKGKVLLYTLARTDSAASLLWSLVRASIQDSIGILRLSVWARSKVSTVIGYHAPAGTRSPRSSRGILPFILCLWDW